MNNNSLSLTLGHKVTASHTGLEFHGELSFEEWSALAPQIGTSLRCMAFVIGDWLVYGEDKFDSHKRQGRADPERYELACRATGIDYAVLRNYAYVSRRVPLSLRNDRLSWEHHRAVAKLSRDEQERWLDVAAEPEANVSSRRLRASINSGRLLGVDEIAKASSDRGVQNHIPHINRICGWWQQTGGPKWLQSRSAQQLEAILRDFSSVLTIIDTIRQEAESRR
jgi:hypothetical protein